MDLVFSFSDLPAWECFPAPAVSRGEFHHSHTCTVQFLILPASCRKTDGLHGLHVTVINERDFVILSQWNNVFSICGGVIVSRLLLLSFSVSQSIITTVDWCLLMSLIPLIKTILSSNLFWMNRLCLYECINKTQESENLSRSSESSVMVLFVQHIKANLFCRWRVKRKTQSPSSLFRQSCGEHSKILHFHLVIWIEHHFYHFSIWSFHIVYVFLFPPQAISDCWAESSSPPGGSGAHHTVWTRHLVLSSFYSLPLGTILYLMEHSCFWLGLL